MAISVITTSTDGDFYISSVDLATARAATSADTTDQAATEIDVLVKVNATLTAQIQRIGLSFDTSSIPADAIITSAQVYFYIVSGAGEVSVVAFTPASSTFVDADYGEFASSYLGSRVIYTGNTGAGYPVSILTSAVNQGGVTELGLMIEKDRSGSGIPAGAWSEQVKIRSVRYGGGSTFYPRLSVIWLPATQTATPAIVGQTPGILSSSSAEFVELTPAIVGQDPGLLTASAAKFGGTLMPALLGQDPGLIPMALSVGGVSTINPSIVGQDPAVMSVGVGARPRNVGPFSAVCMSPVLRAGDSTPLDSCLRLPGDEPLSLTEAVDVDLHMTDQDGNVLVDWDTTTILSTMDGKVRYPITSALLAGVTEVTIKYRVNWQGGTLLAPTHPLTLAVS